MPIHSESPSESLSQLARNMFSDNSNIMLAAIVSLLLVILFVLLLHVYAKWFLSRAQSQSNSSRRRTPVTISGVLDPSHFHNINVEGSPIYTKGLDSAIVSAIPMFVHETEETEELECVICLSVIEEGEVGRSLPKCGHVFHLECIDMWLSSHCNCPICRAPIVMMGGVTPNDSPLGSVDEDGGDDEHGVIEIVVVTPGYEISESEGGDDSYGSGDEMSHSVSETTSSLLGCSLKRMLSKVFLSSDVSELDGSE